MRLGFVYLTRGSPSVDVLFDEQWVSHLEDREAIDKWWFDDRSVAVDE